jgi:hypothetical protein
MLIGATGLLSTASSAVTLLAFFVAFALAATLFLSRRSESNRQLQDSTLSAYQAADRLKSEQIVALQEKVHVQETQIAHLMDEIATLTERVLQVAKVDTLRAEVTHHFDSIDAKLDQLLHKSNPSTSRPTVT